LLVYLSFIDSDYTGGFLLNGRYRDSASLLFDELWAAAEESII
jgi:hypothetical protein